MRMECVFMGWESGSSDGGVNGGGADAGRRWCWRRRGRGHRGKQGAADLRPAHLTLRSTASVPGARRQF